MCGKRGGLVGELINPTDGAGPGVLMGAPLFVCMRRFMPEQPAKQQHNPDPAKQTQRICGLVVLTGLEPSGPDMWDGHVYNPQDGKIYRSSITVLSDTTLKLRAHIGLPIVGKRQTWTQAIRSSSDTATSACTA